MNLWRIIGSASMLLLGGTSCSLTGTVIPLAGETPAVVLVLPPFQTESELQRAFLGAAESALRQRGFYPIPVEVGVDLLTAAGVTDAGLKTPALPAERLAAVARELGADAVLTIRIEEWRAQWVPQLVSLDYDVGYRLWSARTGELQWELRDRDRWRWDAERVRFIDHETAFAEFLVPPTDPGPRAPAESAYADPRSVADALMRRGLALLPPGPLARR
ncbi:MAG: GNA1162 family protein [Planctomycetota bacterium]